MLLQLGVTFGFLFLTFWLPFGAYLCLTILQYNMYITLFAEFMAELQLFPSTVEC